MTGTTRYRLLAALVAVASPAAGQIRDPVETGLAIDTETPDPLAWDSHPFGSDSKDRIGRVANPRPLGGPVIISIDAHDAFESDERYSTDWLPASLVKGGFAYAAVSPRNRPQTHGAAHAKKLAEGIAEIVRSAEKHGYDGSRLILLGEGWGGQMAALLATDPSWLQSAGVNFAWVRGVLILNGSGFDIPALQAGATGRLRRQIDVLTGGDGNFALQLSPLSHAASPNAARFMFHALAKDEERMAEAKAMAAALQEAGSTAQVMAVAHSRWSSPSSFIGHPKNPETETLLAFLREATR